VSKKPWGGVPLPAKTPATAKRDVLMENTLKKPLQIPHPMNISSEKRIMVNQGRTVGVVLKLKGRTG